MARSPLKLFLRRFFPLFCFRIDSFWVTSFFLLGHSKNFGFSVFVGAKNPGKVVRLLVVSVKG